MHGTKEKDRNNRNRSIHANVSAVRALNNRVFCAAMIPAMTNDCAACDTRSPFFPLKFPNEFIRFAIALCVRAEFILDYQLYTCACVPPICSMHDHICHSKWCVSVGLLQRTIVTKQWHKMFASLFRYVVKMWAQFPMLAAVFVPPVSVHFLIWMGFFFSFRFISCYFLAFRISLTCIQKPSDDAVSACILSPC